MAKEFNRRIATQIAAGLAVGTAGIAITERLRSDISPTEPASKQIGGFRSFELSNLSIPTSSERAKVVNSSKFPEYGIYNEAILLVDKSPSRVFIHPYLDVINDGNFSIGFFEKAVKGALENDP